jgi:UDP-N-acetyl-D-glucosamine/UDP-N-acetyl-D-galactosamine dehydrogenase
VRELADYNVCTDVYDPWADVGEAQWQYSITLVAEPQSRSYDAIVLAVAHDQFRAMGAQRIRMFGKEEHVLYDLKYVIRPEDADVRL